ncbi:MAG: trigger factor [Candidatus Eisenbacteria bacterium]
MKHDLKDASDGRTALRVTADWPEVRTDYEDVVSEYMRMPVPGFRAGRAPRHVIEARYRRDIREDFIARCGRRLAHQVLSERNLHTAGGMEVVESHAESGQEFSFTAECVVLPRLELPDYRNVPLAGASDEERRDEMNAWLLRNTAWNPPDPLVRKECERDDPSSAEPGSDAWRRAEDRVKLMWILEQIAEAEGIESEPREVDLRIEKIAHETNVDPLQLRHELGEEGVARLETLLQAEETLSYLLTLADAQKSRDARNGGTGKGG